MIEIVVIGNCQAERIQTLIGLITTHIHVTVLEGVHNVSGQHREKFLAAYTKADLIFTQKIADNYPIDYVRSSFLSDAFPQKVRTFSNFWFNGYDPSFYVPKLASGAAVIGPLDGNHFRQVALAFDRGDNVARAVADWQNMKGFEASAIKLTADSLSDMTERDKTCDVKLGAFLSERHRLTPICHTVNHPGIEFLVFASEAICKDCEIDYNLLNLETIPDSFKLNFVDIAPNQFMNAHLDLQFRRHNVYRGLDVVDGKYRSNRLKFYNEYELVEAYYQMYAADWTNLRPTMLKFW